MLSPKLISQRFPIAVTKVKAVNICEDLVKKIHQIIYTSHKTKKPTKTYIT